MSFEYSPREDPDDMESNFSTKSVIVLLHFADSVSLTICSFVFLGVGVFFDQGALGDVGTTQKELAVVK